MKTVHLIQFTSADHFDYAYEPTFYQWYVVRHLNDVYEYEDDDVYEEFNSIYIEVSPGKFRDVLNDGNNLEYNLLTLEVDDNSQLFIRR